MTMQLTGAFTALITPFRNQEIDESALRSLVDFQISNGIHGLVPCGTTGESATMTEDERRRVIDLMRDADGPDREERGPPVGIARLFDLGVLDLVTERLEQLRRVLDGGDAIGM